MNPKLVIRLVGVSFGLAIALFLFSAIASGHSYHAAQPSHAAVVRVAHHANGGHKRYGFYGGRNYGYGYGNFYGYNSCGGCYSGCGYNSCGGCYNSCYSDCYNCCYSSCDYGYGGCYGGYGYGGYGCGGCGYGCGGGCGYGWGY